MSTRIIQFAGVTTTITCPSDCTVTVDGSSYEGYTITVRKLRKRRTPIQVEAQQDSERVKR